MVGLAAGGVLLAQSGGAGPGAPSLTARPPDPSSLDLPAHDAATMAEGSHVESTPGVYRDGQYTSDGSYLTPGGDESIGVTVVVAHGLVTDAVVRTEASSPTARQFQVQFQAGIAAAVTGRDLAGLAVTRVAGASLTSVGFNDALTRIRFDAGI